MSRVSGDGSVLGVACLEASRSASERGPGLVVRGRAVLRHSGMVSFAGPWVGALAGSLMGALTAPLAGASTGWSPRTRPGDALAGDRGACIASVQPTPARRGAGARPSACNTRDGRKRATSSCGVKPGRTLRSLRTLRQWPYVRSIGTHTRRDHSLVRAVLGHNARRRLRRRRWWHGPEPPQASGAAYGCYSMYTTSEFWRSLLLLRSSGLSELHLARIGTAGRAHLGDRALARLGVHNGGGASHSVWRLVPVGGASAMDGVKTGPRGSLLCYGIAYTPDPSLVLRGVLARCTAMALRTYPCEDRDGNSSSP